LWVTYLSFARKSILWLFPSTDDPSQYLWGTYLSFARKTKEHLVACGPFQEVWPQHGSIVDVAIRRYFRQQRRQYGYAFVDFYDREAAIRAAEQYAHQNIDGIRLQSTLGYRSMDHSSGPSAESKATDSHANHRQSSHDVASKRLMRWCYGPRMMPQMVAAGIEATNVTTMLSDLFPAYASWRDPRQFPHGVDLF
jgi:hypothetical protein